MCGKSGKDARVAYLLNGIYAGLLLIAAPWLVFQALKHGKYRQGFAEKFWGWLPLRRNGKQCAWFHAVSVGEVNLIEPILREFCRRRPEWDVIISTTTLTGHQLARRKYPEFTVCYCPLDFSWAVRNAMRRVEPNLLVLAELELWPNLIREAYASGAVVSVVNGRLSDRSFRGYSRLARWLAPVLKKIDLVAVQTEEYAERFRALGAGIDTVCVTGSVKFDGACTNPHNINTRRLASLAGIQPQDQVFLAGSTQAAEESIALQTFQQLSTKHPHLRLILVPRHPERFEEVALLLRRSGLPWQKRSELGQQPPNPATRILLVDTIGELGAWWGTADFAFVGGSMGTRGGQNMIEPAAYGAAVCFGPHTQNFRDISSALLAANAAQVVSNGEELTSFVERCLLNPHFAADLGQRAQQLVLQNQGATELTVDYLLALLDDQPVQTQVLSRAA